MTLPAPSLHVPDSRRCPTGLIVFVVGFIAACGDDAPVEEADTAQADVGDAGVDTANDVAPADADAETPPPFACEVPTVVDGLLGDTVSTSFDTTATESRPHDLGWACGNTGFALRWAPQEIIEFRVPGEGSMALNVDTNFQQTDSAFNTVIQFREECQTVPSRFPRTCFMDGGPAEWRATGTTTVEGGSTVFIVITGYADPAATDEWVEAGQVRVDLTLSDSVTAPTIADGAVLLTDEGGTISVTGTDESLDAVGIAVNFFVAGEVLDIYENGSTEVSETVYIAPFSEAPETVEFDASLTIDSTAVNSLRLAGADTAELRIYDSGWAVSNSISVPIVEAREVGLSELCDPPETYCHTELVCVDAACAATEDAAASCDEATVIPLPILDDEPFQTTVGGAIDSGTGLFAPLTGCSVGGAVEGRELVYRIDVPEDVVVDLTLDTDHPGTGTTDTIMYVRGECTGPLAQIACNDDAASGILTSRVEAPALTEGSYYIFVESYTEVPAGEVAPVELGITVTPTP